MRCSFNRATRSALADAIERVVGDPAVAARLGRAAFDDARRNIGWDRRAAQLEAGAGAGGERLMVSATLLSLVRCPECRHELVDRGRGDGAVCAACTGCGRGYPRGDGTFLDLRPAVQFSEQTKYLDEALHADARHERVSPPLLGSKIRNDMLRGFLAPQPARPRRRSGVRQRPGAAVEPRLASHGGRRRHRAVLLVGCAAAASTCCWPICGKLPFADGTFTKAYSLDVLEHLSPDALRAMLAEANRMLAPGGTLFVYTHVRKNAAIAKGLRAINAFARVLERAGLIDMRQERLRKSDHVNPLARHSGAREAWHGTAGSASPASATTRRSSADSSKTS